MTESQLLEQVASRLAADPSIEFASVFGSVAEGTARPDSNVDIAVLADAPLGSGHRRALIDMLAQTVGRPVDLVDLREAGPVLLMSALRGKGWSVAAAAQMQRCFHARGRMPPTSCQYASGC